MVYKINGYLPKQGNIIWLNPNPTLRREISKHRPALVVSKTEYNKNTGFIMICPITSTEKSFLVPISGYETRGYINYLQMRAIDFTEEKRQVNLSRKPL